MRKVTTIVMALFTIWTLAVNPARAQSDIVVESSTADYSFGQRVTFRLKASSVDPINKVNLFFSVQGLKDDTAVPISLEPSPHITLDYAQSLMEQNVPPFATITYWWELYDTAGRYKESEKNDLYYADNRYDWNRIQAQREGINWDVYWVQGDVSFGQAALNVAVKSLNDIERELQGDQPGQIRIFIYPSEQDLRSALNLAGYDWAGGQARPELGAILVGIPNTLTAPSQMERAIPHELTHLLVYEATDHRLNGVPPWLNEGLASLNERRPDSERQVLLEQALDQERLLPLEALCAPFPQDENTARLAYAQSASVVSYLRQIHGSSVIRELLAVYADNADCEAGVIRVLGTNLKGLDSAWRADLAQQGQTIVALKNSAAWLALGALMALLTLPFLDLSSRRH